MWRNRNFILLMFGLAVSSTGLWVGIIGNLEFLQKNVESSFLQALIILAGFLVGIFLAPMAGRVIDRSNKRNILIYAGIARCVAILFMYLAIATNSVWWMLIYTFIIGISGTFSNPAMQTMIPLVVSKGQLLAANSVHVNIFTGARIVGTALGGVMLVGMSLFSLYTVTLVSYVILLVATFFIRVDEKEKRVDQQKKKENFITTIQELYPVIRKKSMVINSILLLIPAFLFIAGFNLIVIEISEIQNTPGIKGILYTTEGLCVFIGTFIANRFFKENPKFIYLSIITFVIAAAQLSLVFADHFIPSILTFALFGLAAGTLFPVATTIFQTDVPSDFHGRFFSIKGMVDNIIFQALMLLTGFLLDTVGFNIMVISFGISSFLFVSMIFLRNTWTGGRMKEKSVMITK